MAHTLASHRSAKAQVQAMFDSLALEYVRTREREVSFIAQKRLVIEMLAGAGGRLLEVGCGPAVMTPELAAMGFEVHSLDLSGEMVRRARQRMSGHPLEKRCRFAVGDFEHLEHPGAFFDALLAMGVLEYLPAYGPALRSAARVLKPGGVAVFTVPNRFSAYYVARSAHARLRGAVQRLARRATADQRTDNHCIPWQLDRELEHAGLRKEDGAFCNFAFFPLKELNPALSDSLNRALAPLSRSPAATVLGAQYVVKA